MFSLVEATMPLVQSPPSSLSSHPTPPVQIVLQIVRNVSFTSIFNSTHFPGHLSSTLQVCITSYITAASIQSVVTWCFPSTIWMHGHRPESVETLLSPDRKNKQQTHLLFCSSALHFSWVSYWMYTAIRKKDYDHTSLQRNSLVSSMYVEPWTKKIMEWYKSWKPFKKRLSHFLPCAEHARSTMKPHSSLNNITVTYTKPHESRFHINTFKKNPSCLLYEI